MGCSPLAAEAALAAFRPLPHRLELVGELAGRSFYNDSKATTPEATQAAIRSFSAPLWLLAGGVNKGCDLTALAGEIARKAKGAAFFGSEGAKLHSLTTANNSEFAGQRCETLPLALEWCWGRSAPGDVILLSPACASFDQFCDYVHRGETFRDEVRALREV